MRQQRSFTFMPVQRSRKTKTVGHRARRTTARKAAPRKWSAQVTRHSNALDLKSKVFRGTPTAIAKSLKRSAERSRRRKSSPYRSAMSMLIFYINRDGKNLPDSRRKTLHRAKIELRKQFGRD